VAHFYLSHALFYKEDPEPRRALESYNKAITLNAELEDIWYWIDIQEALCKPFMQSKQYDKAIAIYQEVLEELEKDETTYWYYKHRAYVFMAGIYHKTGELDEAIALYEKALGIVTKWKTSFGLMSFSWQCVPIHKQLSNIHKKKGESQKALFHQRKADELENKSQIIEKYLVSMGATVTISSIQLVLVGAVVVLAGIHLIILKRRSARQNPSSQKGSWNLKHLYTRYVKSFFSPSTTIFWSIKDVCRVYLTAFFFPVVLLIPIYLILRAYNLDFWYFSAIPNNVVAFLLGGLGLFIYWRISITRFKEKFRKVFPDTNWTSSGRSHSLFLLSLWQLICLGVINILLVSLTGPVLGKYLWWTLSQ
jgi:hypothetical protein